MLNESIRKLVQYGIETGLTPECERNYTINLILDIFKENDYIEPEERYTRLDLEEILKDDIFKEVEIIEAHAIVVMNDILKLVRENIIE